MDRNEFSTLVYGGSLARFLSVCARFIIIISIVDVISLLFLFLVICFFLAFVGFFIYLIPHKRGKKKKGKGRENVK